MIDPVDFRGHHIVVRDLSVRWVYGAPNVKILLSTIFLYYVVFIRWDLQERSFHWTFTRKRRQYKQIFPMSITTIFFVKAFPDQRFKMISYNKGI